MLSRVHAVRVRLVLSPSSTLSSFLCFFFDIFVVIVLFLLLIHVCLLLLYLYPCVHYYNHSISLPSSPPFSSSSCSLYSCSSIFVDSFLADVDECTASSPVCGIHFNCINTLGSYRCEYNHSCQGKKSGHDVFIFLMAK